jgi:hypothetical protein
VSWTVSDLLVEIRRRTGPRTQDIPSRDWLCRPWWSGAADFTEDAKGVLAIRSREDASGSLFQPMDTWPTFRQEV